MVNQRMLNGGKQGSGSGLNADLVDAKNASDLGIDISTDTILSNDAANTQAAAEARYAAGLAQVNADGGFFDAYVDSSKLQSLSSLTQNTSSGGKIELSAASSGTGNIVSRIADDSTGSNSGKTGLIVNPNKDLKGIEAKTSSNTSGATTAYIVRHSDGTQLGSTSISSGSFLIKADLKAGTNYRVVVDDGGNSFTRGLIFNQDNSWADPSTVQVTGTDLDITAAVYGGSAKNDVQGVNDVEGVLFSQTGTATHSQFTFTDATGTAFTPSKVGVFPEYNASGSGEDLTIDLVNSSGTTVKTFQQSDFNTLQSVSVSDDTFHIEVNPSGDGSSTPEVDYVDVRGV